MKNTRDSLRPRIKVKKPYRKNTHYTTLFIWSSNQAQRSGCQSFWWERLGIVGGATWNRSDVLFLDPGLGTQLKAGLHSSDGCLDVSNFSTECSLKYRVSHMVISIIERPPVGTGAGKWWALGGCCSVKQDGEDWPHWADVVVKTWEDKGFGHIWAEGGPVRNSMCHGLGGWAVRNVATAVSDQESPGQWGQGGHSYSEWMGNAGDLGKGMKWVAL